MGSDLTWWFGAAGFPVWCIMISHAIFSGRNNRICAFRDVFMPYCRIPRPAHPGGAADSTTLKFIHCDFIESGKKSVLMTQNGVVA